MVPRYTKLDFPTYSGAEDPLIWLHRCEKFFTNQCTIEADKVALFLFIFYFFILTSNVNKIKYKGT
uniref:Uncharacterized protein n=1 Tax=Rhizophora mucronata TaxID=61149 RepID=A0A2P2IJA5_RHIMU